MIRSVVVVVAYLAGCAAPSVAAEPLSTRDILHLNKFGKGLSSISWCTDDTLTFVSVNEGVWGPEASGRARTLNKLSLVDGTNSPFLVYPNGISGAHCARGGEFISVSGGWVAFRPSGAANAETEVSQRFNHLVSAIHEQRGQRRQLNLRGDVGIGGPLLTDVDGNIFGRVSSGSLIERKHINMAALTERQQQQEISFKVTKDSFEFSVLSFNDNRPPVSNVRPVEFIPVWDTRPRYPPKFNVYGLNADPSRNVGFFQCPAPRPGCVLDNPAKTVVIYTSSSYATSKVLGPDGRYPGHPALYTVVPGHNPQPQRWPIIKAYASKHPYELVVVDVVMDAKRCIVLLEQNRELASSRIEGRLSLDLFVADCQVKDGKLEYGEPRKIGHQQGSFIRPTLGIYGESIIIADVYANDSQEEDQIKLEEADNAKARVCARFFTGNSAATLRRVNSVCGLASETTLQPDAHTFAPAVSPGGKFVVFTGHKDPLIVGRDFRQDGRGPDWLTNED